MQVAHNVLSHFQIDKENPLEARFVCIVCIVFEKRVTRFRLVRSSYPSRAFVWLTAGNLPIAF